MNKIIYEALKDILEGETKLNSKEIESVILKVDKRIQQIKTRDKEIKN